MEKSGKSIVLYDLIVFRCYNLLMKCTGLDFNFATTLKHKTESPSFSANTDI